MEKVKLFDREEGRFHCICGDETIDMFWPCERNGLVTQNTPAADGRDYVVCQYCGRIIDTEALTVVGRRDSDDVGHEIDKEGDVKGIQVVIEIREGIIQQVVSKVPLNYVVIDNDCERGVEVMNPTQSDASHITLSELFNGKIKKKLKKHDF